MSELVTLLVLFAKVIISRHRPKVSCKKRKILIIYDVASGSEILPCIKIDKSLVVYRFYRFSGNIDVHNNVAEINLIFFYARNEISKKS